MNDLMGTAYHEASHAVVAEELGGRCVEVSIKSDERLAGWARINCPPNVLRTVCVHFAGGVAKSRFLGRDVDALHMDEVGGDFRNSVQILREAGYPSGEAGTLLRSCHKLAIAYVDDLWPVIKSIAETLYLTQHLDGGVVRMLMKQSQQKAAETSGVSRQTIGPRMGMTLGFQLEHERLAAIPSSVRDGQRSLDAIWYTGVDVPRRDLWTGEAYLLRFDPRGVDLSRLNNRAPILNSHIADEIADQIGVVDRAWEDGGKYFATLRFSRRPSLNGLWQDVLDGVVSKFSMGVELLETLDTHGKNDKLEVRTATKWRPYEISLVSVPADFETTTLSAAPSADTFKAVPAWLTHEIRQREIEVLRLR